MAAKLPQVVAVNLIKDARSYIECVSVLDQHLHDLGKLFDPREHQLRAPHKVPIYFLLGQSVELALKAHLAASGVPGTILSSKEIGHDIDAAFQFAQNLAFAPADKRFPKLVRWLAPYHRDHLFRYKKDDVLISPPYSMSVVASIILKTVEGIEPYVRSQHLKVRETRKAPNSLS